MLSLVLSHGQLLQLHGITKFQSSCSGGSETGRAGWADKEVVKSGVHLDYSWKPEMFSLDDVILLQRHAESPHPDAILIHKGVHDVHNWLEHLQAAHMPEELYWNEIQVRTSMLIESTKRTLPNTALFWRDIYHHHADSQREELNAKMRHLTTPLFQQQGFVVLPGYNVSKGVPEVHKSPDGMHQTAAVRDVMLSMIACTLCPESSSFDEGFSMVGSHTIG